jgi:RHS repeat-associated protein
VGLVEYAIDAAGRRVGKKVGGALLKGWLYDGAAIVAELDGAGNVVSRFFPGGMIKGGATYRILRDHLGSPRLVVNASTGAIAQRMDFDEFGRLLLDTNPGFTPFGFAGGHYDPDTGLVRFGARDYDAEIGRWTAKDPIRFQGGDTNLYGYVFNDPINFVDPSGNGAISSFFWGVGTGIVYGAAVGVAVASGTVVGAAAAVGLVAYGAVGAGTAIYEIAAGEEAYSWRPLSANERIDKAAGLAGAVVGGGIGVRAVSGRACSLRNPRDIWAEESGSVPGRRFTPNQQALVEAAREAKSRGGVTRPEADILRDWANEVALPFRGPEAHPGRAHGANPHIHVGPVNHIPVH